MNDNRLRMHELGDFFADVSALIDQELGALTAADGAGSQSLYDAMRWSLFGGGKRFRPALVFAVGRTLGASDEKLVRTAAAIEMIHTYSLIHDDLPSMDDDDLRRGRATCHVKYGEATAILAGDALQVLAFRSIAEDETISEAKRAHLIVELSRAALRMVIGQQNDLEAEGKSLALPEIEKIHINKTGALIAFSAIAGSIIGDASPEERKAIEEYAEGLGLLFQISDDLLDVTASSEQLGKTAGKDEAAGKATYPSVLGIDGTRSKIAEVRQRAVSCLERISADTSLLITVADFLIDRKA